MFCFYSLYLDVERIPSKDLLYNNGLHQVLSCHSVLLLMSLPSVQLQLPLPRAGQRDKLIEQK